MFPVQSREVDEIDGELEEKEIQRRLKSQMIERAAKAQDFDGLLFIGRQHGYKDPAAWARWIMEGRKKENAKSKGWGK